MNYNVKQILEIFKDVNLSDFGYEYEDDIWDNFVQYLNLPDNCMWEVGATKLVLIPKDSDYVIKIPIEYNETDELLGASLRVAKFFDNQDELSEWDYCNTELLFYHLAENYGINKYFAKIEKIGEVDGHPIYVQEKCYTYRNNGTSYNAKEKEKFKKASNDLNICIPYKLPTEWCIEFCQKEGLETFKKVMDFVNMIDLMDLHSANIGYSANGGLIFIDYADYNE